MIEDYNELSDDYRKYREDALEKERAFINKVSKNCEQLAALKSEVAYLKGLSCYNTECPYRIKTNKSEK